MGAQQHYPPSQDPDQARLCYYEIVGVDRLASGEEIKKSYRRRAMEIHPDRNADNVQDSTVQFAQLQDAYDTLSDPHRRAWYDSHRDANQGDQNEYHNPSPGTRSDRVTSTEQILLISRRLSTGVPFSDDSNGFYGILKKTFQQIAAEEVTAATLANRPITTYLSFGDSDSDSRTTVKSFYGGWSDFLTEKSFAWRDKYGLTDAADRRIRRLMERENKKSRHEAIQEFNAAVNSLVSLARSKDPRYLTDSRTDDERRQSLRQAAYTQAAKSRAANQDRLSDLPVAEWPHTQPDAESEDEFQDIGENKVTLEIECVVCDKIFKSENQYEAHTKSKKHIKTVQEIAGTRKERYTSS